MSNQTLRGLAKNYAKGTIGKDTYRKSRSELIKGIIEGKVPVKAINYEGPLKPSNEMEEAITEGIDRDKTEITSPKQNSKPNIEPQPIKQSVSTTNKKSPFVFILVSAIIVLSLILAVILFYPKPPEPAKVAETPNQKVTPSENTNTDNADANQSVAAETLMGDFLSTKNWNDESLNKFIESWSALTQEQKDAAADTKRMQRMKASIYKQFLESKALTSIDSEKAIAKQQMLIDFANAIGVEDSRLVLE